MRTKALITRLNKLAERSEKKGYGGDAAEYWFRANVLELQLEQIKQFKSVEKQIKYMWQSLDELKEDSHSA